MKKPAFSRFSSKLIISYLSVILFFVVLITIYYYKNTITIMENQLILSNTYTLQQMASNLNSKLQDFDTTSYFLMVSSKIQAIKNNDADISMKQQEFNQFNEDTDIENILYTAIFTSDNINNVYIYTKTGHVYQSSRTTEAPLKTDYTNLIYQCLNYNDRFKSGKLYWIYNKDTGSLSSFKLLNSLTTQKEIGIMELRPKNNFIMDTITKPGLNQSYNIFLFDSKKNVIFQKDRNMHFSQTTLLTDLIKNRKVGNFRSDIDNKKYYVLYQYLDNTGWTLAMTIPFDQINNQIVRSSIFIILIGIFLSLLCIIVSIIISLSISKPIVQLKQVMKMVESGNLDIQISSPGKDEIGDLGRSFNNMVRRLKKLIDEIYVQKLISKESELEALQAQINPHFLYNTLESINCIAEIKGVKEISKMVKTLAQLLRSCISDKNDYSTIEQELTNIESYLYLQNIRFGGKITTSIICDQNLKSFKIPKLILQPVVENAILHGLEQKIGNGDLVINISRLENNIIFLIQDNGVGFDINKVAFRNTGLGIKNVDRRIKILFGDNYGLSITSEEGIGTVVSIILPIIEVNNENIDCR